MIDFYYSEKGRVKPIDQFTSGCWVSVIDPTPAELDYLTDDLGLEEDFVKSALDEEETSRVEKEDDQTLVIVDIPLKTKDDDKATVVYETMPMGIITTDNALITVCIRENPLINELSSGYLKNTDTQLKTRFLLSILLRAAAQYLWYLKQIDKSSSDLQVNLKKSMKNSELIQLLGLQKSLVYFSTSLKANEITLEKILRGRVIKMYEEDEELLEDVIIEVKQAIEMSSIYSNILTSTMEAFGSVTSNNLNNVMKLLTSITVLMAIPTMIYSFYGMNVEGLPATASIWFPTILSIIATAIVAVILAKFKMF